MQEKEGPQRRQAEYSPLLRAMYGPVPELSEEEWQEREIQWQRQEADRQAREAAERAAWEAQRAAWLANPPRCDGCRRKFKTDLTLREVPISRDANAILCRKCTEKARQRTCESCNAPFRVAEREPSWFTCPRCLGRDESAEPARLRKHLSEARRAGLAATLTLDQWLATRRFFEGLCAYCGEMPSNSIDHFTPVTAGGGTTLGNCVPACVDCNTLKGTKSPARCVEREVCSVEALERIANYLEAARTALHDIAAQANKHEGPDSDLIADERIRTTADS